MRANKNEMMPASSKHRYGLRKFSWGVASVLLATTIYMWGGQNTAYATTETESQNVVNGTTDAETKNAVKDAGDSTSTSGTEKNKNNELTGSAVSAGTGNQTTASDTSDKNQTVTVTINFIDVDENNKVLWTHNFSGQPGAAFPFNVSQYMSNELSQYRLVKDVNLWAFPAQNKVYDIYVKHNISTAKSTIFVRLHVEFLYSAAAYNKGNGEVYPPYDSLTDSPFNTVALFVTKKIDGVTHKPVVDGVTHKPVANYQVDQTATYTWLPKVKPKAGYTADPTSLQTKNIQVPLGFSEQSGDKMNYVYITVTYHPDPQTATVKYVDVDDNNKVLKEEQLEGTSEQTVDYRDKIQDVLDGFLKQKYIPDPTDTKFGIFTFDTDKNNPQTFYVHLKRKPDPPKPVAVTKSITNIVHYVMNDGSNAPKDNKQTLTFHGIKNSAGKITWDHNPLTFADVESPTITGYTPDKAVVKGATVTPDSKNITTTVTYTKNVIPQTDPDPVTQLITIRYVDPEDHVVKETKETVQPGDVITDNVPDGYTTTDGKTKITHTVAAGESLIIVHVVKPVVPDNGKHDEPTDPEKPAQPNVPKTPESSKPQAPAITDEPAVPATKQTAASVQPAATAAQLPQTSNKQNRAGLIGLAVAAAGLLFGIGGKRKKN
jgi:hypothetical protein